MNKLEFLKKYFKDVEIIDTKNISNQHLPGFWIMALSEESAETRKNIILTEWRKYNYQFQSTISYLQNNLIDVELIRKKDVYSLLYSVKNLKGNQVYYEGKNPLQINIPDSLKSVWGKLPPAFTDIYNNFHNGWVYYPNQANGLLCIEDVIKLDDLDWAILDEIDENSLPFKLGNSFGFFNNGMGDYVCIDVESEDKNIGFIWWHTKAPRLNIEIWPTIDEWTKIGIER